MAQGPIFAQQTLDWFQVARDGLWELYLFVMQTIRDGRILWVFAIVAGVILYYRFFKK